MSTHFPVLHQFEPASLPETRWSQRCEFGQPSATLGRVMDLISEREACGMKQPDNQHNTITMSSTASTSSTQGQKSEFDLFISQEYH